MSEDDQHRIPGDYSVRNLNDKKAVKDYLKKGPTSPQQIRNIEEIRKRGQSIQKYDPKSYLLDDYLFMQRQNQLRLTFIQKVNRFFKKRFNITFTPDSIIIWKTRKMRDLLYFHLPRMLFVGYTCYICYKIQDKIGSGQKGERYTRSMREEGVCDQIEQINKILLSSDNEFNPNKPLERTTPLGVKSPNYIYQKEKEEYQEEMMKLYEELDADYEKKKAMWKSQKLEEEEEEGQDDVVVLNQAKSRKESTLEGIKERGQNLVELVGKSGNIGSMRLEE